MGPSDLGRSRGSVSAESPGNAGPNLHLGLGPPLARLRLLPALVGQCPGSFHPTGRSPTQLVMGTRGFVEIDVRGIGFAIWSFRPGTFESLASADLAITGSFVLPNQVAAIDAELAAADCLLIFLVSS